MKSRPTLLFTIMIALMLPASLMAQCISGDCKNGEGTYVFQDNSSYTGEFKNGYAEGYGECTYKNGNRYIGHWKAHRFHGEGTFYHAKGEIIKGIWENGKIIETLEVEEETTLVDSEAKIYSVIVGVAAYHHVKRLQYTDDDAYKMYAFLKSPEGGAVPDDQIKVLIDESATKQNIVKAMKDVLTNADENDMIMFYFSGHGKEDSFLPYDFDGYDNKLTFAEINTLFGLSKAKHKICIADACHSGGMMAMKGTSTKDDAFAFKSPKKYLAEFEEGDQVAIMVSSQMDEESVESARLRQGTFSHFLLKGLKGNADRNRDNTITILELFNYVSRQVKSYTGNYQNPVLFGSYDPDMPISTVRGANRINN